MRMIIIGLFLFSRKMMAKRVHRFIWGFDPFRRRLFATLREEAQKRGRIVIDEPIFDDKKQYPVYDLIHLRIRGFDFLPLERYQAYVHNIAKRFGFNVVESFAVAAKSKRIVTFRPHTSMKETEMELHLCERAVNIAHVLSPRLPLFIAFIQAHAPVGVEITVKKHEKEDESRRYIPDLLLDQKKNELKSLDDPNVRRNLGWE